MLAKTSQFFIIAALVVLFSLWVNVTNLQAKGKTARAELIAVYLFRLAENIQWANEARIQNYKLHLVGSDRKILSQLNDIAKIKKLHGKSFTVTQSSNVEIPADINLVFISKKSIDRYAAIFKQVEGRNILLISNDLKDKRRLMINLLDTETQNMTFEINKANIINQNLGIKPDIILMGGTEIDVAKLYKQSQVSLQIEERRAIDLDTKRITLEKSILQANIERASLEEKLAGGLKLLDQQKDKIQTMEVLIREKEGLVKIEQQRLQQIEGKIKEQSNSIEKQKTVAAAAKLLNASLARKNQKQQQLIDRQKALIEQERQEYEILNRNVKERETALREQESQIKERSRILSELDEKIAHQDAALASQSKTIVNQRNFLIGTIAAASLLIILVMAIFRGYQMKRKANMTLLAQKQLLEQATNELAKAKQVAESANVAKTAFLANMNHELRTPLNVVLGFSRLMQDDPLTPEKHRGNLEIIKNSGIALLQLINSVLDMSKIEAGLLNLESIDFDLGILIDDVINMMQGFAEEKDIQLLFDRTSEFPRFVHGDELKIRQILINLLSNAIKCTDVGEVSLRLDSENEPPDIYILRINVADTGCGLRPENIEQIFLPFEQLPESQSQKGTGLGLTITQQFVELMEGSIQVESELGKGSLFSVKIQVLHEQEAASIEMYQEERAVLSLAEGSNEYRIMIVEDHNENRLLLLRMLELAGFNVKTAENGLEAVTLFQQWKPHFIWMDRRMPVMGGMVAVSKIRLLPSGKDVIIVALTASVFQAQKKEILAAGCDDFIRKPYKPEDIFSCMKKHLGLQYRYKDESSLMLSKQSSADESFDNKDFISLDNKLLNEINLAAMAAQGEGLLTLLKEHEEIPEGVQLKIKQLVSKFQYDKIVKLCKR